MKMIWKTIEDELTGEFARGYALAQFLHSRQDVKRTISANYKDVACSYEWEDFEDYGDSSPQEWREETGHIICTDDEADEMAYDYIMETLWAFTPSFLAGETGIDIEVFEALAENGKCESNNDAIESLIKASGSRHALQEFVDAAIGTDGRGHYINSYDGSEHEVKVGNKTFYIYRMD